MENVNQAIDEIVNYIKSSSEYKNIISIKSQMCMNDELNSLISSIKSKKKKYVRSGYDFKYKEELDKLNEQLNEFPIYFIYQNNLEVINQKINYITPPFTLCPMLISKSSYKRTKTRLFFHFIT